MKTFEPKPYKLINKIQHYEWGTKNDEAFIPRLLRTKPEKNLPYAELWIGVHKNAPSEIVLESENANLAEIINKYPNDILGERVAREFDNKLPFLFKILSINTALSIQAHPNKKQAVELNKLDPVNYPDDNHKPEIAIAIDKLKVIVGLKTYKEIKMLINSYEEFSFLLNSKSLDDFNNAVLSSQDNEIKKVYASIIESDTESLEKCVLSFVERFKKLESLSNEEEQFIKQFDNYGVDIGLISILLFNFYELKNNEALFTAAGIPHAYIKGNIIECMANSDNVVRAGLTKKYKDINTLSNMLEVDSSKSIVTKVEKENITYFKTHAKEFEVQYLFLNSTSPFILQNNKEISILFVLEGKIVINWEVHGIKQSNTYISGETVLLPAILSNYVINSVDSSKIYKVIVP